jgi:hypothetical protein
MKKVITSIYFVFIWLMSFGQDFTVEVEYVDPENLPVYNLNVLSLAPFNVLNGEVGMTLALKMELDYRMSQDDWVNLNLMQDFRFIKEEYKLFKNTKFFFEGDYHRRLLGKVSRKNETVLMGSAYSSSNGAVVSYKGELGVGVGRYLDVNGGLIGVYNPSRYQLFRDTYIVSQSDVETKTHTVYSERFYGVSAGLGYEKIKSWKYKTESTLTGENTFRFYLRNYFYFKPIVGFGDYNVEVITDLDGANGDTRTTELLSIYEYRLDQNYTPVDYSYLGYSLGWKLSVTLLPASQKMNGLFNLGFSYGSLPGYLWAGKESGIDNFNFTIGFSFFSKEMIKNDAPH